MLLCFGQRRQWVSWWPGRQAAKCRCVFDALAKFSALLKQGHQWQHRCHDFATLFEILVYSAGFIKCTMRFGCEVSTCAYPTARPPDKKLKRLIIGTAGQLNIGIVVGQKVQSVDVTRAFLNSAEILCCTDLAKIVLTHVGTGAARIVVEHDRQVCGFVDCQCVCGVLTFRGKYIRR